MKKFAQLFTVIALVLSVLVVPVAVHAQVDPIPVDDGSSLGDSSGGLPSTGATPTAPDTGVAPSSRVAQTLALFVVSSLIGAGVAFGAIQLHKKQQ